MRKYWALFLGLLLAATIGLSACAKKEPPPPPPPPPPAVENAVPAPAPAPPAEAPKK
jgi:hypothetical protein